MEGRSNNCSLSLPSIAAPSDGLIPSARSIPPAISSFKRAELSGIDLKMILSNLGRPSCQ